MRTPTSRAAFLLILVLTPVLAGCVEVQSVMSPQGVEAKRVAALWWILLGGSLVILLGVILATMVAMSARQSWRRPLSGEKLVIGGGIIFPIAVLSLLLTYSLFLTQVGARTPLGNDALRISVVGERWWWRVIYGMPDGGTFESANEIRIPAGRPVEIALTSADVIHSFWVPKLAGKLDMIPGRVNTLTLEVDEPVVARGQCAEYCGGPHALMSFYVVTLPGDEFDTWLARESGDARAPATDEEQAGQTLFAQAGCGACHRVRGTDARSEIGPDLTHVGSRRSLAAATLPADEEAFQRWIAHNQEIKPDNLMPPYRIFDDGELAALASYLKSLE